MKSSESPHSAWSARRFEVPGGDEYFNVPSLLARRVMYYPISVGMVKWQPQQRHQHPSASGAPFHDDRGFIFHFVLNGELAHRVKRQLITVRRNEGMLLDLRQPVEYVNDTAAPARFWWVWFDGQGLVDLLEAMGSETEPVFRGLRQPPLLDWYRRLVRTIERRPAGYELIQSSQIAELLAILGQHRPPLTLLSGGPSAVALSPPVHLVATTIARQYARCWSIKELCAATGLSIHHFCRKFRRETGYTLIEYLNRYRIEQAKMLLATTSLPIDRIAAHVGVPNRKHFTTLFHQIVGTSPREFRAAAGVGS